MDKFFREVLILVAIGALIFIGAFISEGHEYGHADGIHHLTGSLTPGVDGDQACPGQDKVLLYHDIENDGVMDVCSTLWVEHEEVHIIVSEPGGNDRCECEGYLWLEGDSQK